ncbi:hypothetical protein JOF53_001023 [Crossiella equi]|uniref:SRPBCC family protein n=1 Tax=Crossiella equi TaxID=130796 RepID=A0ABS5A6H2_9PSEU|nr:SRPBCC family protein [Crossiella equi]MBP2472151.1 hypothetical protein [Crossiella equi]
MSAAEFSTVVVLPVAPEAVFAHLADPHSYLGLSPLIVEVRDVRPSPGLVRYTAVERFRLGPLHHDNIIEVTLRLGEGTVEGDVVSPGGVRLAYGYRLSPALGGGTRVVDWVRLTAPFGLRGFAAGQARKVQLARGRELVRRFPG